MFPKHIRSSKSAVVAANSLSRHERSLVGHSLVQLVVQAPLKWMSLSYLEDRKRCQSKLRECTTQSSDTPLQHPMK